MFKAIFQSGKIGNNSELIQDAETLGKNLIPIK